MTKTSITNKKNTKRKIRRIVLYTFLFLAFLVSGIIVLRNSLNFETQKIVKYNEISNLDYKVYLIKNDFYEQEYLGKNMLYVASLINKVGIDFNYKFTSDDKEDIDFTYNVYGKLTINNLSNTKSYFEKTYTLLENKKVEMKNGQEKMISEHIDIDYQKYNNLANEFKRQFGIESDSKLIVYMVINKKNGENSKFIMDNDSLMNVQIPVSEKAIDIKLDYKEINETNNIIEEKPLTLKEILPIAISVLLIIISIIIMLAIIRIIESLRAKRTKYDKYIDKILKEYDRLIAESSSLLSFDDKEIITINKFTELLDIHDNLQLPIMYYEEEPHELAYFYISHDNVIYLLRVSEEDIKNE